MKRGLAFCLVVIAIAMAKPAWSRLLRVLGACLVLFGLIGWTPPALPPGCTATTDIPEFREEIKRACLNAEAKHIKSVSLMGDAELVTLIMTYTFDFTGRRAAQTPEARLARQAAIISHDYFYRLLPMKRFRLIMRDTKDQEMCRFTFEGETRMPRGEVCMSVVGGGGQ